MNENSENLMDRQLYAQTLKRLIKIGQSLSEYMNTEEKQNLKNLKIKLSNYDVYKQKIKCQNCQEVECICYELSRSNEEVRPVIQQGAGEQQLGVSIRMEDQQGTTGDSDSDFQERIDKLF